MPYAIRIDFTPDAFAVRVTKGTEKQWDALEPTLPEALEFARVTVLREEEC